MDDEEEMFRMPSRYILEKTATKFLEELYQHVDEPEIEVFQQVDEIPTAKTFAQDLEDEIARETTTPSYSDGQITKKSLQTEMALFEATGGKQRGENLEKLYLALKNIAPTSIASEQAFSIASNFVPQIRSLLSDQSIDNLCFEKSYFAKEK